MRMRYGFGRLGDLQRDLNELFDYVTGHAPETGGAVWQPAVDIRETNDGLEVLVEAAGIDAKDVDISVHGEVLTIKGERKVPEAVEKTHTHLAERSYGKFGRSFRLPVPVATDKVSADYKHGVLRISLPKAEPARTREIKVNVAE